MELPFVFNTLPDPSALAYTGDATQAQPLADRMQGAWIRFIETGDVSRVPELPFWPEYDIAKRQVMLFNNACLVAENPQPYTLRFWDTLSPHAYAGICRRYNDGRWRAAVETT